MSKKNLELLDPATNVKLQAEGIFATESLMFLTALADKRLRREDKRISKNPGKHFAWQNGSTAQKPVV